jgi:hypothetical protein
VRRGAPLCRQFLSLTEGQCRVVGADRPGFLIAGRFGAVENIPVNRFRDAMATVDPDGLVLNEGAHQSFLRGPGSPSSSDWTPDE